MLSFLNRIPKDLQQKIKRMSDDELTRFIKNANELIWRNAGWPAWQAMDLRRFAQSEKDKRKSLEDQG